MIRELIKLSECLEGLGFKKQASDLNKIVEYSVDPRAEEFAKKVAKRVTYNGFDNSNNRVVFKGIATNTNHNGHWVVAVELEHDDACNIMSSAVGLHTDEYCKIKPNSIAVQYLKQKASDILSGSGFKAEGSVLNCSKLNEAPRNCNELAPLVYILPEKM